MENLEARAPCVTYSAWTYQWAWLFNKALKIIDFHDSNTCYSSRLYGIQNGIICILADSGFFKNLLHQGGVKSTVFWVFEDLKFKNSEGYDQNWCFPDSAQRVVSV